MMVATLIIAHSLTSWIYSTINRTLLIIPIYYSRIIVRIVYWITENCLQRLTERPLIIGFELWIVLVKLSITSNSAPSVSILMIEIFWCGILFCIVEKDNNGTSFKTLEFSCELILNSWMMVEAGSVSFPPTKLNKQSTVYKPVGISLIFCHWLLDTKCCR